MIKVLVITLYCDENEYEQCCKSVNEQEGLNIEHKVIKNLPKQEAHQKLYQLFNENRERFDFFAKLDADMAFSTSSSLKNIIQKFDKGVDIVSATVHDGITNSDMQSFNVFSSRCYFEFLSNDPLFTDNLDINYKGRHISYIDDERNVLHAFNPTPFQAFMFGVHRALKVVQPKVNVPKVNNSYYQRRILNDAYLNYINNKSEHSRFALLGATLVFQGDINSSSLYQKDDYYADFKKYIVQEGIHKIDSRLSESNFISLYKIIGKKRLIKGTLKILINKLSHTNILKNN